MPLPLHLCRIFVLGLVVFLPEAQALVLVWTGGSGTWNTSNSKWKLEGTSFTWSWTSGDTAKFNSGSGTVTLGENITANSIEFNTTGPYVVSGGASDRKITLNGTGGIIKVTAGAHTINARLAGTKGLTKNGTGDLTLAGANTYTGTTKVNNGTLLWGADDVITDSSTLNIASGAEAHLEGFTDTIGGLSGAGGLLLMGGALTVGANDNNTTYSGNISGGSSSDFIKTGTGTLTLSSNTSTGATFTVAEGTLALGHATNTLSKNADVMVDGGTLDLGSNSDSFDQLTVRAGAITGTGTLTANAMTLDGSGNTAIHAVLAGTADFSKTGSGTVTLHNQNTYTGDTLLGGGLLELQHANALAAGTTLSFSGGGLLHSAANTADYSGQFATSNNQQYRIDTGGQDITWASDLTSSGGSLHKAGTGTLTLSGTNSYDGATTVDGGTLTLGSASALNATSGVSVASGATLDLNGFDATFDALSGAGTVSVSTGQLTVGSASDHGFTGNFTGSGVLEKTGSGRLTLSGDSAFTGQLTLTAGSVRLGDGGSTGSLGGNIVNAGTLELNRSDDFIFTNSVTGTGDFVQVGSGNLTLSGAQRHTGGTTVSAGTLTFGHATDTLVDTSAVTIGGGTLALGTHSDTVGVVTLSSGSITGSGTLTGSAYNLTDSGSISAVLGGTAGLTKSGAGTVTLSGANTYTGSTTLSAGTLQLGADNVISNTSAVTVEASGTLDLNDHSDTIASLAGAGTVALGTGTLTLGSGTDTAFTGLISGTGALVKQGTGTLTLGGSNTYSGGTTLADGALLLDHTNALGSTGSLTLEGGTLIHSANNTVDYSARFSTADNQTYAINTNGQNISWAGDLSSSGGSLTKDGLGTLTLSGTNTYTGSTQINAGVLRLGSANAFSPHTTITIAAGATLDANGQSVALGDLAGTGTLDFGSDGLSITGSDSTGFAGILAGTGGLSKSGTSTLTLTGTSTYTGDTDLADGTLEVGGTNALGTGTLQLNGGTLRAADGGGTLANTVVLNATTTFDGSHDLQLSGAVTLAGFNALNVTGSGQVEFSGSIGESAPSILIKQGGGELALTGANTFTGGTFVQAGTVRINNVSGSAFGTGAVTIGTGATLTGAGSFSGALQLNGTFAPGNSPGTTHTGSQTWAGDGELIFEIDDATGTQGGDWDLLAITGSLTLNATAANPFTVNVDTLLNGTDTAGAMDNFDANQSYSWVFVTTTTGISFGTGASIGASFVIDTSGFAHATNGSFGISQLGNNLALTYTTSAVPEPGSAALLLGVAAVLWRLQRRTNRLA
jgi:autotransporter-associated beta strand protein